MSDPETDKAGLKKVAKHLLGLSKPAEEKKGRYVTVSEEKRRLKRVVKAKPMARKHMSEAFKAPSLTEEELRITETVLRNVAAPARRAEPAVVSAFDCYQCGAKVPYDADRCPKCGSFYIRGLKDEDVDEMLRAEQAHQGALDEIMHAARLPVVHFDAEMGVMQLLEEDQCGPDVVFECNHCGALVEVSTDRCPICNTVLKLGDTGLAGLFAGMDFDPGPLQEGDCPFCGEYVRLEAGSCPSCGSVVAAPEGGPADKVMPLLRAENIVFVHLDIETGSLNFLQRTGRNARYEQVSVQLEGIGTSGFDREWSSLSRI